MTTTTISTTTHETAGDIRAELARKAAERWGVDLLGWHREHKGAQGAGTFGRDSAVRLLEDGHTHLDEAIERVALALAQLEDARARGEIDDRQATLLEVLRESGPHLVAAQLAVEHMFNAESDRTGDAPRVAAVTPPSSWATALEDARTTIREGMAEMSLTTLGPDANEVVGAADALARLLPDLAFHVAGLEVTDNDDAKRIAAALAADAETFAARIDARAAELDALAEVQPPRASMTIDNDARAEWLKIEEAGRFVFAGNAPCPACTPSTASACVVCNGTERRPRTIAGDEPHAIAAGVEIHMGEVMNAVSDLRARVEADPNTPAPVAALVDKLREAGPVLVVVDGIMRDIAATAGGRAQ